MAEHPVRLEDAKQRRSSSSKWIDCCNFSDRIMGNKLLNDVMVAGHMLFVFFERNILLVQIESHRTRRFKQSKYNLGNISDEIKRRSQRWVGARIGAFVSSPWLHRLFDKLTIPRAHPLYYLAFLVGQILVFLRCAFILVYGSFISTGQVVVSATKSYNHQINDIIVKPDNRGPIERQLAQQIVCPNNVTISLDRIEALINDRYQGFRLLHWSDMITRDAWRDWILPELHPSFQMMYAEIKVLMLAVCSTTMALGILGPVIAYLEPYDLPVMSFIYEPEFAFFYCRQRFLGYLELTRRSFIEFSAVTQKWRTKQEGKQLSRWSRLATRRQGAFGQHHFESFCPLARCQQWRHFLLLFNLWLQMFLFFGTFLALISLIYYNYMLAQIDLNNELNSFASPTNSTIQVSGSLDTNQCPGAERQLARVVGERMQDLYNKTDFRSRGSLFARAEKRLSFEPSEWLQSGIFLNPTILIQLILIAGYANMYLVMFLCSIADLVVWLLEIRMKLDIAVHLLRHQNSHQLEPPTGSKHRIYFTNKLVRLSRPRETGSGACCQRIGLRAALSYLWTDFSGRSSQCQELAIGLVNVGHNEMLDPRRVTEQFLLSTYLSMRLLESEIELCRHGVDHFITFAVLQSVMMIGSTIHLERGSIKFGVALMGLALANMFLVCASSFQNQCRKFVGPMHSILAWCMPNNDNSNLGHSALLWRRYLTDISSGSHSKFAFRVNYVIVSYATCLQFNFTIISLYLITLDRAKV